MRSDGGDRRRHRLHRVEDLESRPCGYQVAVEAGDPEVVIHDQHRMGVA